MKKKLLFTILTLLLVFSVFGGAYAKNEAKHSKVELLKQRLVEFRDKVDNDIALSFNINLGNLTQLDRQEIFSNEQYKNIAFTLMDVMIEQEDGDIIPSVYLDEKNNELYILEKKSDGMNVLHKYVTDSVQSLSSVQSNEDNHSTQWVEVNLNKADGKIIEFDEID
ncbi:hypothetical protein KDJ56_17940 [Brevibacillus composti]|uniref:Uncharacterized protein n=1 Tax=Brevibacillus composti TaxID=2796470 RepID=A0A7T5JN34_9BACL|nr:hypothetical protein [Brevibacillus composti]QQE73754.1 hypothetical protein JD108_18000 [Brevibacillus composti]QUO40837.1 hypothetical protein KDJ56_17940 [Brevibacillus composti]